MEREIRRTDFVQPDGRSISGSYAGSYLEFSTSAGEQIIVRIASAHSFESAQKQLDDESGSFDEIHQRAENLWSEKLNLIEIKGGTEHERELFYSTLYNSLLAPRLIVEKRNGISPSQWRKRNCSTTTVTVRLLFGTRDAIRLCF